MVEDNHTWLANRSVQCGKKGRVGAASKPGLLQLRAPHCLEWRELEKEAVLGQLHSLAIGTCVIRGVGACSGIRMCECVCVCLSLCMQCHHTDALPPGWWGLANI